MKRKQCFSLLLALLMLLSMLSVGALAQEAPAEAPEASAEIGQTGEETAEEAPDEAGEAAEETPAEAPALDAAPPAKPPESGGGSGGSSSSGVSWSGAATITSAATQTGQTYSSSTDQQNALLINTSGAVTLQNPRATKTGAGGNSDNYSFYGINSAIMVKGGTTTTISGGTVTTSASGANGVFSYGGNGGKNGAAGDGTTVNITGTTITTTGSGAGGIMTTGGGVMNAYGLTVTTSGGSSAPIRTDRGGGTVFVDGGTYTSNGLGSPAIYSTASVTVQNATLVSNLSEGVCIEGKNSITLKNCDLTANNTRTNGNATFLDTIMIYQSMSGDADSGTSSFTMEGGSLTSKSGHVFHVTNTNAVITLTDVQIKNTDSRNILLSVCADGWSGAGNTATLNANAQTLEGGILVGSDSKLTMSLKDNSVFKGYVSGSITNAKGTSVSSKVGTVSVTLDGTSKWSLTADSNVTSFSGDPANVINNGYTLYVNGKALAGTTAEDSGAEDPGTDVAAAYGVDLSGIDASGTGTGRVTVPANAPETLYIRATYVYTLASGESWAECHMVSVDKTLTFRLAPPSAPAGATLEAVQTALVTDPAANLRGAYTALFVAAK